MSAPTLRRALLAVHDALKGKPTLPWLRRLDRSQWQAPETLADLQLQGLRRLLRHAFETVPYHRRALDAVGLAPDGMRSAGDLRRLPYLTRDDLRLPAVDLTSVRAPRRVQRISTGGSTGAPVTVLVTMEAHGFAEGARLRAQGWYGLEVGDSEAVLWGSSIELLPPAAAIGPRQRPLCQQSNRGVEVGSARTDACTQGDLGWPRR